MKKEMTLEKLQEKYQAIQEEMVGTDYSQCLKAANNCLNSLFMPSLDCIVSFFFINSAFN